jgi:hypothetical protein
VTVTSSSGRIRTWNARNSGISAASPVERAAQIGREARRPPSHGPASRERSYFRAQPRACSLHRARSGQCITSRRARSLHRNSTVNASGSTERVRFTRPAVVNASCCARRRLAEPRWASAARAGPSGEPHDLTNPLLTGAHTRACPGPNPGRGVALRRGLKPGASWPSVKTDHRGLRTSGAALPRWTGDL